MKKSDVIEFFGSVREVSEALGISGTAIYKWDELIPEKRAARLHVITEGRLAYAVEDYQPKQPEPTDA